MDAEQSFVSVDVNKACNSGHSRATMFHKIAFLQRCESYLLQSAS